MLLVCSRHYIEIASLLEPDSGKDADPLAAAGNGA